MKDMYNKPTNRTELLIPMNKKPLVATLSLYTNQRWFLWLALSWLCRVGVSGCELGFTVIDVSSGSLGRNGCNCPNQEKREKKEVRCYRCGGGHIVKYCPHDEIGSGEKKNRGAERENEVSCVTGIFKEIVRSKLSGVPVIDIRINGKSAKALVDTGCTRTMVREGLTGRATGETVLAAFDGREVKCKGSVHAEM